MSQTQKTNNQRYDPAVAERKKLEKQVNSLKNNQFSISASPTLWECRKNDQLGVHFVTVIGSSKTGNCQQIVYHRPIGYDYKLDKDNDWCASKATDIAGFLSNSEYPGKAEVVSNLAKAKVQAAIRVGSLKSLEGSDYGCYPDGTNRKEALDQARAASAAHSKVKGGTHFGEWILYMPSALLQYEMAMQASIDENKDLAVERVKICTDLTTFTTSLVDGTRQKHVPYLYGVPEESVVRHIYQAMVGVDMPTMEKTREFSSGYLPYKMYSDYKPGDQSMRSELVRMLESHSVALKERNIAKSYYDSAKDPKEKANLKPVYLSKEADLKDIVSAILKAEDTKDYPKIKAIEYMETSLKNTYTEEQVREVSRAATRIGKASGALPSRAPREAWTS